MVTNSLMVVLSPILVSVFSPANFKSWGISPTTDPWNILQFCPINVLDLITAKFSLFAINKIDDNDKSFFVGKYLLFECYKSVDPEELTDAYNDLWLKKYISSLFKRQWGSNLLKFEGLQLPGGTTLNGRQIFDDATTELQMLDDEIFTKYQLPDDFMTG